MPDNNDRFDPQLADLSTGEWLTKLAGIAREVGDFTPLGPAHFAALVGGQGAAGDTFLVSFETIQTIRALNKDALPISWKMTQDLNWSSLCIAADGDTWFRDAQIYDFFDTLVENEFFKDFSKVIFYGAGPCAYAAAAFSQACPNASVIAVQPQATLDPQIAGWDDRFVHMRRTSFEGRYGYAPDMLKTAKEAFVLYDPTEQLDAMHATLFTAKNVTKLHLPHLGNSIHPHLVDMEILYPIFIKTASEAFDRASFAHFWRTRRDYLPYLRRVMSKLEAGKRAVLIRMLCENVARRTADPKFTAYLEKLKK